MTTVRRRPCSRRLLAPAFPPGAGAGKPRDRRAARGMLLLDMLIGLSLLAAFSLVAARLLSTTLRVSSDATRISGNLSRFDNAVAWLRADVWGAREVQIGGPQAFTVRPASGPDVMWQVDAEGTLSRMSLSDVGAPEERRWPEAGAGLGFEWDGVGLTVRETVDAADRGVEMRLISQLPLAAAKGAK